MTEALERYGKVIQCEELNNMLHIKLTDGFDINMKNTIALLAEIIQMSDNKFPTVHKCVTEKNLFHLILKK
jgi:hypothetical protein